MRKTSILDKFKLEEGWFSLAALVLAFMTVVWSIEAAHWTQGLSLLPRIGIAGLLLGFGLAKARFVPGLLAHSFTISVGMVFVGLLVSPFLNTNPNLAQSEDWTKNLGTVVLRVVKWGENAVVGRASYDALVFLVALAMLTWISGYAVAWMVFRRHQVWSAITLLGAILIVNLSYNPPNPLGSFSLFLGSSLLLVVRLNAFLNEARWSRLRIPHRRELWRGAMAAGSGVVLVIMLISLILPSSSQIEPLGQVLSQVNNPLQQFQSSIPGFGVAPNDGKGREGRLTSSFTNLSKSFTIGGPITLSDSPIFRVKGDDTSYLQVAAMDKYDGKGWLATYQDPATNAKLDRPFSQLSLNPNQSLPTTLDKGRASYNLTVYPVVPNFNPVLSSGDLVKVDRAALLSYHWELVTINSPLAQINPKTNPDGNGGTRTVLLDENSRQIIPPDLLPLVTMLKEAQKGPKTTFPIPLSLRFRDGVYTINETYTAIDQAANRRSAQAGDNPDYSWQNNGWTYKLPAEKDLKALNLKAGGPYDRSGQLKISLYENSQPDKVLSVSARNVYLSQQGIYTFELNPGNVNTGDFARTRFEATEAGQKIKAEVERLRSELSSNKVSYALEQGLPSSLNFEGYQPNYDDLLASTMQQAPAPGESYVSLARRFRADEESLRNAAGQAYPNWVTDRYLELPVIPARVKQLAQEWTVGLTNPYDKAKAIEAQLRKLPYSLNAPATPEDRDPVDFFLFDSKTGYCVHYSSALNVMLRSLGIPTREMTGFNGGDAPDPATGLRLVRSNAAHAWTQVYFPGFGWLDFEPTPGGGGQEGLNRPADPAAVPPIPTPVPEVGSVPTPAPGQEVPEEPKRIDESPAPVPGSVASLQNQTDWLPWLWLAGLLGSVGLSLAYYQLEQWWVKRQLHLPDVKPMAVYDRMLRSAYQARLRPLSTMTPYEFAVLLGRKMPLVRGEVRSFTDGYVRKRYGPAVADEDLQREISEIEAARARIAEIEAEGGEPSRQDLREAYRNQTVLLQSAPQIRQMWESYQLGLIAYRRRQRIRRLTPGLFRAAYRRLGGLRHWVQQRVSKFR